ncbi:ankyrin repeat protein [Spatholobus suberectus]|nr:ankyrin repeat protein [Spatholobus suberectus]
MASEAPSWADQWGAEGIGAMEDDGTRSQKDTGKNKNSGAGGGFTKVKAAARIGVQKIKSGASICVAWIKNQFKRKRSSK